MKARKPKEVRKMPVKNLTVKNLTCNDTFKSFLDEEN
jgi:hypothetical protein